MLSSIGLSAMLATLTGASDPSASVSVPVPRVTCAFMPLLPAARVVPGDGDVTFFIDAAAASQLG